MRASCCHRVIPDETALKHRIAVLVVNKTVLPIHLCVLWLASTYYEDLVAAPGADVPGRDGAGNTDDNGAEYGRPESGDGEVVQ